MRSIGGTYHWTVTTLERVDFTPFVVVCRVNLHVPAVLGATRFTPVIRQPPVTVHLAVALGQLLLLEPLLAAGCDFDARDSFKRSALHYALLQ